MRLIPAGRPNYHKSRRYHSRGSDCTQGGSMSLSSHFSWHRVDALWLACYLKHLPPRLPTLMYHTCKLWPKINPCFIELFCSQQQEKLTIRYFSRHQFLSHEVRKKNEISPTNLNIPGNKHNSPAWRNLLSWSKHLFESKREVNLKKW